MSVISVKNLVKEYTVYKKEPGFLGSLKSLVARKYEKVKAVENISFEIEEGELIGFIGPNGAGKTTTLKCLSGLLYPTSGEVKVLGYTPFDRKTKFLKSIALVMGQKNQLWWDLPAMETFLLNKEIYEIPTNKFNEVVGDLSKLLEVEEQLKVQVRKLSLGQRMKMELIAALLHNPKVLFLDEPTIGLDVVMQQNLREFVGEYNRKYKATILLTSHYMGDVEALCKRVIIINHGKILFDGMLSELVKKHAPYKVISIVLNNMPNPKFLEDLGEIEKFKYPELVIKVPRESASEAASKILSRLPVEDVNIENPSVEDIIRDVFSAQKAE
ncbi:MAG TPA: ATP-binding cassette domain-containing protein [Patescibacteria group bacterium]